MNKLVASNIEKFYGTKQVLHDINISIKSGEVVGLLGANGAGKTTLFYIISGLLQASKGSIFVNDKDITNISFFNRTGDGIGYLPQEVSIFKDLSVEDNIKLAAEICIEDPKIRKQKIENILEMFNIEHIRRIPSNKLSGGERRRVEISRMLVGDPKFLLFDEPFAGVDPISIADIRKIIRHLAKQDMGILITDHSVRDILDCCDRIYVIKDGRVVVNGTKSDVIENPIVRQTYLGEDFSL
jgi:lipopolysaccharide export system ATP-binding protein